MLKPCTFWECLQHRRRLFLAANLQWIRMPAQNVNKAVQVLLAIWNPSNKQPCHRRYRMATSQPRSHRVAEAWYAPPWRQKLAWRPWQWEPPQEATNRCHTEVYSGGGKSYSLALGLTLKRLLHSTSPSYDPNQDLQRYRGRVLCQCSSAGCIHNCIVVADTITPLA